MGAGISVPLIGRGPDHPLEARQLAALVEVQLSITEPPLATALGVAVRLTVGLGMIVTLAVAAIVPPEPVQASVYVAAAVMIAGVSVPLIARPPDHPPDAVQLEALVEDQVSVVAVPLITLVGVAARLTVGAGVGA
jgi:hypothetical protein